MAKPKYSNRQDKTGNRPTIECQCGYVARSGREWQLHLAYQVQSAKALHHVKDGR